MLKNVSHTPGFIAVSSVWSPYTKQRRLSRRSRWFSGGLQDGSQMNTRHTVVCPICWAILDGGRLRKDATMCALLRFTRSSKALLPPRFRHILSNRKDTPVTCIFFRSDKFTPLSAIKTMTIVLWNRLPADLIQISDLDSFKSIDWLIDVYSVKSTYKIIQHYKT